MNQSKGKSQCLKTNDINHDTEATVVKECLSDFFEYGIGYVFNTKQKELVTKELEVMKTKYEVTYEGWFYTFKNSGNSKKDTRVNKISSIKCTREKRTPIEIDGREFITIRTVTELYGVTTYRANVCAKNLDGEHKVQLKGTVYHDKIEVENWLLQGGYYNGN